MNGTILDRAQCLKRERRYAAGCFSCATPSSAVTASNTATTNEVKASFRNIASSILASMKCLRSTRHRFSANSHRRDGVAEDLRIWLMISIWNSSNRVLQISTAGGVVRADHHQREACSNIKRKLWPARESARTRLQSINPGAGCRDRTRDPVITNHVLYQLS